MYFESDPGFGLVYHVLDLCLEAQVIGLGLCVLDSNTGIDTRTYIRPEQPF